LLYVVHRLDPKVVARVVEEYHRKPEIEWPAVKALLQDLGRSRPPAAGSSSWEEYEERLESEGWNLVLTIVASETSWDLDKSLDRPGDGLPGIAALLPGLGPVKALLSQMESFDSVDLPKAFRPPETGLMGIATETAVSAALPAANEYARPDARRLIADAPVPWLKKAFGGSATLAAWREDDYLWDNWCRLMEAIRDAATRRHWLALEVA
jgi:hypothetical protein